MGALRVNSVRLAGQVRGRGEGLLGHQSTTDLSFTSPSASRLVSTNLPTDNPASLSRSLTLAVNLDLGWHHADSPVGSVRPEGSLSPSTFLSRGHRFPFTLVMLVFLFPFVYKTIITPYYVFL